MADEEGESQEKNPPVESSGGESTPPQGPDRPNLTGVIKPVTKGLDPKNLGRK